MASFDDDSFRAQKRSFPSNIGSFSSDQMKCDDAIDVMFKRAQHALLAQPAWFGSSPASSWNKLDTIPHLEQHPFEMNLLKPSLPLQHDSTITELCRAQRASHCVRDRCATAGYRILTMGSLIENADLVLPSVRPRHVPAPTQVRPLAYRSLSALSSIVDTPR